MKNCDFIAKIKNPFVIASFFTVIFIYSGFYQIKDKHKFISPLKIYELNFVEGKIISNPSVSDNHKNYSCNLRLTGCGSSFENYISSCSAEGVIKILIPAQIVEALYPGKLFSLSSGKILFENGQNIKCSGKWIQKKNVFIVQNVEKLQEDSSVKGKFYHYRGLFRLYFKKLMYSWKDAGGLILSLLSGSREYLAEGTGDLFRKSGLSHILALSGMHLSFFSGLSGGITKRIFGSKYIYAGKFAGILLFAFFAGISPSLFRALLCSGIMMTSEIVFCQKIEYFTVLCVSFLIHCVSRPEDIFSSAFMLSYGALAGILLLSDFIKDRITFFIPEKISGSLAASAGAQISTAGISIKMFGMLFPIGMISTIFVSPLISVFLTVSLVGIILCLIFPFLANPFGFIVNLLYKCIYGIVSVFSRVPEISFKT